MGHGAYLSLLFQSFSCKTNQQIKQKTESPPRDFILYLALHLNAEAEGL